MYKNKLFYYIMIAYEYYSAEGFYHAMRVADYVNNNPMIPGDKKDDCVLLAILHDILEDTEWNGENELDSHLLSCLKLLTKDKDVSYDDYIEDIASQKSRYPEAYWVKIADVKDHLNLSETLTDYLKDKYTKALAVLL